MLGRLIKGIVGASGRNPDDASPAPAIEAANAAAAVAQPLPSGPSAPAAGEPRTVIAFRGHSRSDGLAAGVHAVSQVFTMHGYNFVTVDLRTPEGAAILGELSAKPEEILFVAGSMGLADDWQIATPEGPRSVWNHLGIPYLGGFGDHPAYHWERHRPRGPGFFSFYVFQEHLDATMAWMSPPPLAGIIPPWPFDAVDKSALDFPAKRGGKVYFFKNGNDPEALLKFWRSLPAPLGGWLMELAHSIDVTRIGRGLDPLHLLVRDFVRNKGYWLGPPERIEIFLVAQMDDYARRIKSTLIAQAILDLPVHIFGDNWGHVDFTGRRALHSPGQSYFTSCGLVNDALAVLDMSPNTQSAPHERFMGAAGRYTLCLSNVQQYHLDHYPQAPQMLFEFEPEAIRERVAGVLAQPGYHVDLGVAVAEHARALHDPAELVRCFVDGARLARIAIAGQAFAGQQDFVNWPVQGR
ncbi:MAG: hypothetical protein JWN73_1283 [Betaproteobacteria bacterium]|nr:hypothetical protein [Betaproteobacteria bacterium]